MDKRIVFEKVSPEAIGLSSSRVLSVLENLDKHKVPIHSFLLSRGNKLCLEAYYHPFVEDTPHRIYSCTKSFVSLAIGKLIDMGKIKLSDKIVSFFPEKCPAVIHPFLEELTIENMLRMSSCYSSTTYKKGGDSNYIKSYQKDWVGSFFTSTPDHKSGDIFLYDTSATHTLCALVEKLAGKSFLQFLQETFLLDIGCSEEMKVVKDPMGTSVGGSGLILKPIDLLRVIRFVALGGSGLISSEYIKQATSKQIDNLNTSGAFSLDTTQGYGYQFWMMRDNSFAMYGLGGQFAIYIPQKDITVVTTADTQGTSGYNNYILDAIWDIADSISSDRLEENSASYSALQAKVASLALVHLDKGEELPDEIIGKRCYEVEDNSNGLKENLFRDVFKDGALSLEFEDSKYLIPFGFGYNVFSLSPFSEEGEIAASGTYLKNNLSLAVKLLSEEFGSLNITIALSKEKETTLFMKLVGELSITGFSGIYKCKEKVFA